VTDEDATPFTLHKGDVLKAYDRWPAPHSIMSDGAYGVRGFHGDTTGPDGLAEWYAPHIAKWTEAAAPGTTLWFWNTEVGWATVHPLLIAAGWEYKQLVTWDKGLSHIAGNVNGKTIRHFPVVTEVVALYSMPLRVDGLSAQEWMRREWLRAGLKLNEANAACGVANAATRKYLTQDWLWYWPPVEAMEQLVAYANERGTADGWPYYSLDGERPVTGKEWERLRYPWQHVHGLTNVWSRPPLHDAERLKGSLRRSAPRVYKPTKDSAAHLNQKPLEFMERLIAAVTRPGEVVWEPFGGLASGSVAAVALGRRAFVAELDKDFHKLALQRLQLAAEAAEPGAEEASLAAADPGR
jgi:site-specific DNA-methyltransferase (adenine-specific)